MASGTSTDVEIFGSVYAVRADQDRLRQILVNLLSNAIKFTPDQGRISVIGEGSTGPPGRTHPVTLHVRDTGIGIPGDLQARVFEPFFQVGSGQGATARGTGLGLAISRQLARGMGGDLTLSSTPGEGSTFSIALPGL